MKLQTKTKTHQKNQHGGTCLGGIAVLVLVKGVRPGNGSPGEETPDIWGGGGGGVLGEVGGGDPEGGGGAPWSGEAGGKPHTQCVSQGLKGET